VRGDGEREQQVFAKVEADDANGASRLPLTSDRSRCLVIQTAFLGDVVLTTPLLSRLAEQHGPVDVVTTPGAAGLLEHHPAVASVLPYDKRGADRGWRGVWRMGARLRSRQYRRVYLPHRSLRSATLALWSGAAERVGFDDSPAALTYTSRIMRPRFGHEVERLLTLAGRAGRESPPVTVALTPADQAAADTWLSTHQVGSRFIAVAPGSIWATKRWPYYQELVARLEYPSVLVGGPEDVAPAAALAAGPAQTVSAAGALTLRESAALIRRATVLVTNDSAPLHLATAVGTPVIALFGPTVPEFGFGPRRPGDLTLGLDDLPCRPCSKHGPPICPLGHHRCMRDLSVDQVLQAIATIARAEDSRAVCPRN
jgi:heptosyltransferase II